MNFKNITLEISAGRKDQLLPYTLPEIAFSGKSNVGKSTLLNALVNRKALARVSSTPGKTVTINYYNVDNTCRFVDLPGYGYAKVSKSDQQKWAPVVDFYFTNGHKIDLLVQLFDMRHAPSQNDLDMLSFINQMNIPRILVLTKSDKLNKTQFTDMLAYFKENFQNENTKVIIPFSALDRTDSDKILNEIDKVL